MISLLSKKILNICKFFFYPLIVLFLLFEIFFQIVFFFDIKPLKKTILFYNPYCDQKYWDNTISSNFNENIYTPHPILTFIKKENEERFNSNFVSEKSDIIFYGSSFVDHKYFIPNFKNKINYGVKSYGLDQIYTSYKITKKNHPQKLIVIGFLPEDLDRTIFNHRNFPKLKYKKKNLIYEISNTPISLGNKNSKEISFYLFNFIKNITFLIKNKYDYKTSECKIVFKKDIFKFFVNDIILNSKNLNQKIIFVTFSFLEDIEDVLDQLINTD